MTDTLTDLYGNWLLSNDLINTFCEVKLAPSFPPSAPAYARVRAKREHNNRVEEYLPESQGQNLASTVLNVPCPFDS